MEENGLSDKPAQIYNCDEAAVYLNKTTRKVVVPKSAKHAHTVAHGTSEHITVLLTVRADGGFIPPPHSVQQEHAVHAWVQ